MSKLPRDADPRKVLRALQRLGFVVDHVSGSHYAEHGDIPCDSPGDARCARGIPGSLPRPLAVGIAIGWCRPGPDRRKGFRPPIVLTLRKEGNRELLTGETKAPIFIPQM